MVAFLDLVVRIEKRGDKVVDRGAGSDADEVGADWAADSADGVACDALEIGPPINRFAAMRIAFRSHALDELGECQ
mgnify:CR=1 FL=1